MAHLPSSSSDPPPDPPGPLSSQNPNDSEYDPIQKGLERVKQKLNKLAESEKAKEELIAKGRAEASNDETKTDEHDNDDTVSAEEDDKMKNPFRTHQRRRSRETPSPPYKSDKPYTYIPAATLPADCYPPDDPRSCYHPDHPEYQHDDQEHFDFEHGAEESVEYRAEDHEEYRADAAMLPADCYPPEDPRSCFHPDHPDFEPHAQQHLNREEDTPKNDGQDTWDNVKNRAQQDIEQGTRDKLNPATPDNGEERAEEVFTHDTTNNFYHVYNNRRAHSAPNLDRHPSADQDPVMRILFPPPTADLDECLIPPPRRTKLQKKMDKLKKKWYKALECIGIEQKPKLTPGLMMTPLGERKLPAGAINPILPPKNWDRHLPRWALGFVPVGTPGWVPVLVLVALVVVVVAGVVVGVGFGKMGWGGKGK